MSMQATPRRTRASRSFLDENTSSPKTSHSLKNATKSRKMTSLHSEVRRPSSRSLGGRASLGSLSMNGAPRTLSASQLPAPKDLEKPTRDTIDLDGEGNKENIAPFRLASLSALDTSISRARTRRPIIRPPTQSQSATGSITASISAPSPRLKIVHTLQFTTESQESDSELDGTTITSATTLTGTSTILSNPTAAPLSSSPRLIRTITSYQKDGKVVLRFGKVTPYIIPLNGADSSGSESDSDCDAKGWGSEAEDGSESEGLTDSEVEADSSSDGSISSLSSWGEEL